MSDGRTGGGRKRDPAIDDRARNATLELVAEIGFDATTMEAIAARSGVSKAALYRRWPSKEPLVIDAVVASGWNALTPEATSSGDLRTDLLQIIGSELARVTQEKVRVLNGVLAAVAQNSALRRSVTDALVEPRAKAIRAALEVGVARGDVAADADLDTLSEILPALLVYRLLIKGQPVTRRWQHHIVDAVILPAVQGWAG